MVYVTSCPRFAHPPLLPRPPSNPRGTKAPQTEGIKTHIEQNRENRFGPITVEGPCHVIFNRFTCIFDFAIRIDVKLLAVAPGDSTKACLLQRIY